MLILAGVSINAVVGDNGILSKATDAVYLNSCAYLEEYFNQLYATCAIDGNIDGETPLDTIIKNGYQNYFFSTSEGYGYKKSIKNEETGVYDNLVFYLIKKEQLPEDIQKQLTAGNANKTMDFRKLNDVYGITSDLKVYYISSGIDTILGLTKSDLNADSPDIVAFEQTSTLAQMLNGGSEAITNQGLKSIKTLWIDSQEEISVIQEFSKFSNLTTVNFQDITIQNLKGIEGAKNSLNYLKFKNCEVMDYSALNELSNLTYLYLIKPVGKNAEVQRLTSADKGIKEAEFTKLNYLGIVGNETYLQNNSKDYSSERYDITDISGLGGLNSVTKKAVKYLYLQNMQIQDISCLADFSNVITLRVEGNALKTLNGIQKMANLTYLIASTQYSNSLKAYTLGSDETTTAASTDALAYIYKNSSSTNTKLRLVQLQTNSKLKHVEYLSSCTAITNLYLSGCSSLLNVDKIAAVLGKCGTNYSLNAAYGNNMLTSTASVLSLGGTIKQSDFEKLMNDTNLVRLSLNGLTLTTDTGTKLTTSTSPTFNEEVYKVLSTCKNLKYLQLYNLAYLTSIDFIGNNKVTQLIELDLRRCANVTNLTTLNTYAQNLKTLGIDNNSIDLTTIQPTINRLDGRVANASYYLGGNGYGGFWATTWELWKQLENCTELTRLCNHKGTSMSGENADGTKRVLDLSRTKITYYNNRWFFVDVKFPNTLEYYNTIKTNLPEFASDSDKLTFVHIDAQRDLSTEEQWENFMKMLGNNAKNLESFSGCVNLYFNFEHLKYLSGLEKLVNFGYWGSTSEPVNDDGKTTIKGIGYLTHLKTFKLYNTKNIWDISDLSKCTDLEEITIYGTNVSNISCVSSMPKLHKLIAYSNSIKDIYPILNCKELEEVDFRTNLLTDSGYHNSGNGSIGYDTLDIFYSLNQNVEANETLDGIPGKLKNVKLKGNNFTDTELIKSVEWETPLDI
ncbi:MAG: hypothetical protein J6A36_06005 [Clostridia bacterium]|nr:hypothetical protein [Clostridia bacterium]